MSEAIHYNNDSPTETYLTEYYHNGTWWASEVQAFDEEDAEVRAKKMGMRLCGKLVQRLPAETPTWFVQLLCFIRNIIPERKYRWKFWHPRSGLTGGIILCCLGLMLGLVLYHTILFLRA